MVMKWRGATLLALLCLLAGCGTVVPGASADQSVGLSLPNPDPCSYFTPEIAAEYLGPTPSRSDMSSPSNCVYERDTETIGFSVGSYDPRRQSVAEVLGAGKEGRSEIFDKCPDVSQSLLPPGMSAFDWDESQGVQCVFGSVTYVNDGRVLSLYGKFPATRMIATMRQIIGM